MSASLPLPSTLALDLATALLHCFELAAWEAGAATSSPAVRIKTRRRIRMVRIQHEARAKWIARASCLQRPRRECGDPPGCLGVEAGHVEHPGLVRVRDREPL